MSNQFVEFCERHPTYASVALRWKHAIIKYLGYVNSDDENTIRAWEKPVDEIIFSLIRFNKDEKDRAINYNEFASRYKTLLDQSSFTYSEREKELALIRTYLTIRDNEKEKESYNVIELLTS